MVKCMGQMYVVMPTRLDEIVTVMGGTSGTSQMPMVRHEDVGTEFIPLQFYILQLEGAGLVHGVLRMRVPQRAVGNPSPIGNWFSCSAIGSVIWV